MTLQLTAKTVDAVANGDYYQVVFGSRTRQEEEEADPFGVPAPYLLIQCQFELPDDGLCYVESDREDHIGHFKVDLLEFTRTHLSFDMEMPAGRQRVEVTYKLSATDFEEAFQIVQIIFGKRDPLSDDEVEA